MHQFKVETTDLKNHSLEILGEEAHHGANVLRLKEGTIVSLFDGVGNKRLGTIVTISSQSILIQLHKEKLASTEPPIEIILYQAIAKKDNFELIIQKSVELGVKEIIPIITKRTIVQIHDKKSHKKVERWNKIAQEACKQSGRAYIPQVHEPLLFKNIFSQAVPEAMLISYEQEEQNGLRQVLRSLREPLPTKIGILIGPEGGWEPEEVQLAVDKGAHPVTLGPRILRTETASLAMLAMVLYELGDLGG